MSPGTSVQRTKAFKFKGARFISERGFRPCHRNDLILARPYACSRAGARPLTEFNFPAALMDQNVPGPRLHGRRPTAPNDGDGQSMPVIRGNADPRNRAAPLRPASEISSESNREARVDERYNGVGSVEWARGDRRTVKRGSRYPELGSAPIFTLISVA